MWGVGEGGGGGAGPRVGAEPPGVGEGAVLLLPSELWRWGSSGPASPPAGPLEVRYSGGGGAKEEDGVGDAGGFPPEVGGRRLLPGEGGGFEGRGGVLPGAGGRGLSLLYVELVGGEGAAPRRLNAGGGGGDGERAWPGGWGAAPRAAGEREAEPSERTRYQFFHWPITSKIKLWDESSPATGLSLGTPAGNRPVIGGVEPDGLPAVLPLVAAPLGSENHSRIARDRVAMK